MSSTFFRSRSQTTTAYWDTVGCFSSAAAAARADLISLAPPTGSESESASVTVSTSARSEDCAIQGQ